MLMLVVGGIFAIIALAAIAMMIPQPPPKPEPAVAPTKPRNLAPNTTSTTPGIIQTPDGALTPVRPMEQKGVGYHYENGKVTITQPPPPPPKPVTNTPDTDSSGNFWQYNNASDSQYGAVPQQQQIQQQQLPAQNTNPQQ